MDIDRTLRIIFIGMLFAVVYTLSKPLTLSILAAIAAWILVLRYREVRGRETERG